MKRIITLFVSLIVIAATPARAQSPNTAAVVVIVEDQSGAAVTGAAVALVNVATGATREVASGADGSVTIPALPLAGAYSVTVSKAGFATETAPGITLRASETAMLRVRLNVGGATSEVVVYGTTAGVRADPQLGMRLPAEQIESTPLLGRKITYLPLLNSAFRSGKGTGDLFVNQYYFVTGAGGRREATFAIDGATGDEPWGRQTMFSTLPIGAVLEMNALSSAFSAEYGWTASPAINVVTKSGTNDLRGDLIYVARPGGEAFQQRTATSGDVTISPADVPDELQQIAVSAGGPVVHGKTFVFGAVEYSAQDRTAYFAAIPATQSLLDGVSSYTGNYRQFLLDGRVDHKLGGRQTLMVRVNIDRFRDNNPQDVISGTTLPSAGRSFHRHTSSYQGNHTAVVSDALLNEARAEYQHGDPITNFDPLTPSTQFTRAGVATEGESRYSHVWSHQWQLSDTLSWTRGRHYLRAGGNLARATSGGDGTEFGGAFVLGQFTINPARTAPISQLNIADATRYAQTFNFGVNDYTNRQWIYAVFAQDALRLGDDLTLDLGMRYDRQTFSDGKHNVAPRLGMAWHPNGDARTAIRAGYSVFYTMIRANTDANFTLGGPEGQFSYSAAPGQLGFPGSLTAVPITFPAGAVLPARNVTIRPGRRDYYAQFFDIARLTNYPGELVNPKSRVTSVGVERDLGRGVRVQADYVHQRWTGLDRSFDLNAPAVFVRASPGQVRSAAQADATRPITPANNGFRSINVVANLGDAEYDGLQTFVSWRPRHALVSLSYTLSKATNTTEPNGNGPGPNDFNQLGEQERGPSILDQRHRAVLTGMYSFARIVTVGTITQMASARPFNPTTGVDNNGDGSTNDRPVIDGLVAGRASFRGSALYDTSVFAEARVPMHSRALTLRVEAFNVFNHANILGRIGVYGDGVAPNATFGTPNTGLANLDPARMIQFQAKFQF
jgi:outer membrane receptor protein involved in Fe transport